MRNPSSSDGHSEQFAASASVHSHVRIRRRINCTSRCESLSLVGETWWFFRRYEGNKYSFMVKIYFIIIILSFRWSTIWIETGNVEWEFPWYQPNRPCGVWYLTTVKLQRPLWIWASVPSSKITRFTWLSTARFGWSTTPVGCWRIRWDWHTQKHLSDLFDSFVFSFVSFCLGRKR